MNFFEKNAAALAEFTRVSQAIGARPDYVQGGGGNTSVKLDGGRMAIKASGYRLADIQPNAAYAVVDCAPLRAFYNEGEMAAFADVEKAGSQRARELTLQIEGLPALRPSVEAGFHSLLGAFVAHSHSVYANLAACCENAREAAFEALAGADYEIGFVPYVDPGARLTFFIRDELRRVKAETGRLPGVIFMQNHGIIATSDDAGECLRIHDDANARVRAFFGASAFPKPEISGGASATRGLRERLASGRFGRAELLDNPLYPDQLVFFADVLAFGSEASAGKAVITPGGEVLYGIDPAKAMVIEETLAAVVYVIDGIERKGFAVSTMSGAAQKFISGWESEAYRKSMIK